MDPLALLRFHQLFDSAFPTGAFAHSGGIETYAKEGLIPDGLADLIRNNLALGYGRLDLAACILAHRSCDSPDTLESLGWKVDAQKVVEGPRNASLQMGRRVAEVAATLYPRHVVALERPHYAVVVGAVCGLLGVDERSAALGLGQSMVLGSLTAATRCMRLGPVRAQSILTGLHAFIATAVDEVLTDPEDSMFSSVPGLDMHARLQASLDSRLFQS